MNVQGQCAAAQQRSAAARAAISQPCIQRGSSTSSRRGSARARASKVAGPAADWITQHCGAGQVVKENFFGGSNWSSQYVYETEQGAAFFVKTAMGAKDEAMFRGEAAGLQAMHDTGTLRIPNVFHVGPIPEGRGSFIVMEFLDIRGSPGQAELGRQLARMHKAAPSDPNAAAGKFGFSVDNTIGATPQPNGWMDDWVAFYRDRRLRHQLKLAGDRKLSELGEKLCSRLDVFFEDVRGNIRPSVLHGDLWSGNIGGVAGQPAIFDPAVYYGHSEAEFGMSWCAGFTEAFWQGYHGELPKAPLFDRRQPLYQLYHYLNHYNLFGGGYYNTSVHLLEQLTAGL